MALFDSKFAVGEKVMYSTFDMDVIYGVVTAVNNPSNSGQIVYDITDANGTVHFGIMEPTVRAPF